MEEATLCRVEDLGELEILNASYERYEFTEHSHPEFVIAVTDHGQARFKYRRGFHAAGAGTVLVHHPGEVHSGGPFGDEGWTYRAIYVPEDLFKRATASPRIPFFGDEVIEDKVLAGMLRSFHRCVNSSRSRLERESHLIQSLAWLTHHHADSSDHSSDRVTEPVSVRRAREYLHAHLGDDVSAAALARASGLSPYHLIRVFSREVGLTPHAYQLSIRIQRAKDLLRSGTPLADVALQTGFFDQPHFTKAFKSRVGVTPARYGVAKHEIQCLR